MPTPISDFDYDLPEEFIAESSVEPRDHSKLMLLDKKTGKVRHTQFFNIVDELNPGDVLVFNTSKVFKARLAVGADAPVGPAEIFVLRIKDGEIEALLKPGKKFEVGSEIKLHGATFVVTNKPADGVASLRTGLNASDMLSFCDEHGSIPTPPYVKTKVIEDAKYQNVYAKQVGSVAAPTAGFHFTNELLQKIKAKGVQIEELVLHVGIGTFRPVQTENIEDHTMHSEWVTMTAETARRLREAKAEGRRIIAVGTTTTRALEGVASMQGGLLRYEAEVNMFITPGYQFKVIDGLITNFHLPKSTLLVLVSALAGRENILKAYREAKLNRYRFFSFGDAMFIR
jgi:S-adenosylmethionine:tRNA ribosyltransferase-isomerase